MTSAMNPINAELQTRVINLILEEADRYIRFQHSRDYSTGLVVIQKPAYHDVHGPLIEETKRDIQRLGSMTGPEIVNRIEEEYRAMVAGWERTNAQEEEFLKIHTETKEFIQSMEFPAELVGVKKSALKQIDLNIDWDCPKIRTEKPVKPSVHLWFDQELGRLKNRLKDYQDCQIRDKERHQSREVFLTSLETMLNNKITEWAAEKKKADNAETRS